jgi:hypothetical protein
MVDSCVAGKQKFLFVTLGAVVRLKICSLKQAGAPFDVCRKVCTIVASPIRYCTFPIYTLRLEENILLTDDTSDILANNQQV